MIGNVLMSCGLNEMENKFPKGFKHLSFGGKLELNAFN